MVIVLDPLEPRLPAEQRTYANVHEEHIEYNFILLNKAG